MLEQEATEQKVQENQLEPLMEAWIQRINADLLDISLIDCRDSVSAAIEKLKTTKRATEFLMLLDAIRVLTATRSVAAALLRDFCLVENVSDKEISAVLRTGVVMGTGCNNLAALLLSLSSEAAPAMLHYFPEDTATLVDCTKGVLLLPQEPSKHDLVATSDLSADSNESDKKVEVNQGDCCNGQCKNKTADPIVAV